MKTLIRVVTLIPLVGLTGCLTSRIDLASIKGESRVNLSRNYITYNTAGEVVGNVSVERFSSGHRIIEASDKFFLDALKGREIIAVTANHYGMPLERHYGKLKYYWVQSRENDEHVGSNVFELIGIADGSERAREGAVFRWAYWGMGVGLIHEKFRPLLVDTQLQARLGLSCKDVMGFKLCEFERFETLDDFAEYVKSTEFPPTRVYIPQ
jgi:hypothetical protein